MLQLDLDPRWLDANFTQAKIGNVYIILHTINYVRGYLFQLYLKGMFYVNTKPKPSNRIQSFGRSFKFNFIKPFLKMLTLELVERRTTPLPIPHQLSTLKFRFRNLICDDSLPQRKQIGILQHFTMLQHTKPVSRSIIAFITLKG